MKEIDFGGLGFNIVNSYDLMKSRIDDKDNVCLFGKFTAKPRLIKRFLGANIEFKFDSQQHEFVEEIYSVLLEQYGLPDYIANGSMKVWKIGDCYVSHGIYEEYYQNCVHILTVTFQKPYVFMRDYNEIKKYVDIVLEAAGKWNVSQEYTNYSVDGNKICFFLYTKKFRYMLYFNKKNYTFYASEIAEKDGLNIWRPVLDRKGKYKGKEELSSQLDSFFFDMFEHDECVHL